MGFIACMKRNAYAFHASCPCGAVAAATQRSITLAIDNLIVGLYTRRLPACTEDALDPNSENPEPVDQIIELAYDMMDSDEQDEPSEYIHSNNINKIGRAPGVGWINRK